MNKFFDFSEHKEITTENVIDMSTNAIGYMETLMEIYSNNIKFDNKLEDINSKFDITNTLVNNLREYGLNAQVASFIKSNYNNATINMLVNDIDSLQYGTNKKLADEVANALEAINVKEWINKIIAFLKDLWKKFIKFLKSIPERTLVLQNSIVQARKRYLKMDKKTDISNIVFNTYGGIWKLSNIEKFVNEVCVELYGLFKDYGKKLKYYDKMSFEDIEQWHKDFDVAFERIMVLNKTIEAMNATRKTKLRDADIEFNDLISQNSLFSYAHKAAVWVGKFRDFDSTIEELMKTVEEFVVHNEKILGNKLSIQNKENIRYLIMTCEQFIMKLAKIYKYNLEIVRSYCIILNNHPDYKSPSMMDAILS